MASPLRQPIILELRREGWTFTLTKKNHIVGTHPQASAPMTVAGTSGDRRSALNARAQARRLLREDA